MGIASYFKISSLLILAIFFGRCAAPSEPGGMSNSGSDASKTSSAPPQPEKNVASPTPEAPVNYGGAKVGTAAQQIAVSKCVSTKKFYDRVVVNGCTKYALAEVSCTDDAITQIMSTSVQASYKAQMTSLVGFKLDQCVDCKVSKELCAGKFPTGDAGDGTLLYLINGEDGVAFKNVGKVIKVLYIPKKS